MDMISGYAQIITGNKHQQVVGSGLHISLVAGRDHGGAFLSVSRHLTTASHIAPKGRISRNEPVTVPLSHTLGNGTAGHLRQGPPP